MKFQNIQIFLKQLKEASPLLCVILSEETHILQAALEVSTYEKIFFDGDNFSLAQLLQEIETRPTLTAKKCICVRHIEKLDPKQLELILARLSDSVLLILQGTTLKPSFVKECDQKGYVLDLQDEKSWEKEKRLTEYAQTLARASAVALPQNVAKMIAQQSAKDEAWIASELEKLICFAGNSKTITEQAVEHLATKKGDDSLFPLMDALFARDIEKTYRIAMELYEQDLSLFALIAFLRGQFKTALEVHAAYEKGKESAVQEAFPYLRGAILQKKIESVHRFGAKKLNEGLLFLFDVEVYAKNTTVDPLFILEQLVIGLCRSTSYPTFLTAP